MPGQGSGVETIRKARLIGRELLPKLEFQLQTTAVKTLALNERYVPVSFSQRCRQEENTATGCLLAFHCSLPASFILDCRFHSHRLPLHTSQHLFYTPLPLSLGPRCPDPWSYPPLSAEPHLPIITCNKQHTYTFYACTSWIPRWTHSDFHYLSFTHSFDNFIYPTPMHLE